MVNKLETISKVGGLVLGVIFAVIYGMQLSTMKGTLAHMKEEGRPNVSLQRIDVFNFEAGKNPAFQLEFLNSGRSSARNIVANITFGKIANPCKRGKLRAYGTIDPYGSVPRKGFTIAAGQPLRIQISLGRELTAEDFNSFQNTGIDR